MSPGDTSRLAARLADAEGVKPAHVAVVLSLAAQSGKDGTAVISAAKLAKRCGMSRSHAFRSLYWATDQGIIEIDAVDGRSNRYRFAETILTREQGTGGTMITGEQGGTHPRVGGYSPVRHVSSNYSSITSGQPEPDDGGPRMSMAAWLASKGETLGQARGAESC